MKIVVNRSILICTLILSLFACGDEGSPVRIPYVFVNEDINLKNLQYQALTVNGGHVYLDIGYRGVIIYNYNGVYKAFERACTYDPASDCTPVEVDDSGLFMVHTCCNSSFDFEGNPMGGPAAYSLFQYSTYVDGDYLLIRND